MKPNEELIARFVEWITIEKGLAGNTINGYRNDLKQFADFLCNRQLVETRKNDIGNFMAKLLSDGIEGRSVARKVSSFRQFFRFLLMECIISTDPTVYIRSPKAWKVLPKALATSEIDAMLGHSTQYARLSKYLIRRDQALLELLYAGGLRASEIIGARLSDLKLSDRLLIVRGKGDKERIVPFGIPATVALQQLDRHAAPAHERERLPVAFHRLPRPATYTSAGLANRSRALTGQGQSSHASPQLRDTHAGERCRPASSADASRTRRHFHY
jgi:integrase/recombinase XerD